MKRLTAKLARWLALLAVACAVLVVAATAVVWFLLPRIDQYKPQVERLLSEYLGQQITMTSVNAEWRGLNLVLRANGVRVAVEDHPGSGMRFGEILFSVDPMALIGGARTFESLELVGPTIEAARLPDGRFRVGDTIIGTPRGTVRRLLQGRRLEITDGTLVWRDALSTAEPLQIDGVHLAIQPAGQQRQFVFSANAPATLLRRVSGRGTYDPRSLGPGAWDVSLQVSAGQLDLALVPEVIQERLPWRSRGEIDADISVEWSAGRLTAASADVAVRDFVIPYARDKTPLSAERFTSTVSWRRAEGEWRLLFDQPEIVLDGEAVSVSHFELERSGEQRKYSGEDVNVADLLGVVNRLEIELPWEELIDRLAPRGVFSRAALTLTGPYLEATGWRFEGDFRNVGWRAQQRYPGVDGIDGHLVVDERHGELSLEASSIEVDAPRTLRHAVGFEQVEGRAEWYRMDGNWVIDVTDAAVVNDDLSLAGVAFHLRVPGGGGSPHIHARARIQRADVARLRQYLPARRMTAKQVAWLDRALAGGEITGGRLYFNGSPGDFPFENGSGKLRVRTVVKDGLLDFHEKWPNLEKLNGVIELEDSSFEARVQRGVIMNSPIETARVWSEDFFRRDRVLHIDGDMQAEADDVIQFLRRGPLNRNPPPPWSTMSATGSGDMAMRIELPFTRLKQASRVKGDYVFDGVAVEVTDGVEVTDLTGRVQFTDSTVEGSGLTGRMLGGPVRADVSTVEPGRPMTFAISGSGEADLSRLTPVVGPVLVSRLSGRAPWQGRFVGGPGPNELDVDSELQGVEIDLPPPVGKLPEEARRIDVQVEFDDARKRIRMAMAGGLEGELHYDREEGRPVLVRGVLNLGTGQALPERELAVAVRGPRIDADQWLDAVARMRELADADRGSEADRDALFSHLRWLDVEVDRMRYLQRNLGAVTIDAESADGRSWTARLDGERVRGSARLALEPRPARYRLDMSRLHWPQLADTERAVSYETPIEPSEFPHLAITAEDFRYGEMQLGRLDLQAGPEEHGWRIRRLSMQQPALIVEAAGRWSADRVGAHRTRVDVSAESNDLGEALNRLGLADQVANGEATVDADLNWAGEPGDFRLAALNGEMSFGARDGRFLKLEPGSGRLLGLFNLDTLVRRFKFDFTDVFEEGLAFDRINGEAEIASGRLRTDGILIAGPAALMEVGGTTDMAEETYGLEVTVAPQLGSNLSLAGAIANPTAGAMIFVFQKLFKNQMAKLIHYKYRVSGPWENPRVEQVEKPEPDTAGRVERN